MSNVWLSVDSRNNTSLRSLRFITVCFSPSPKRGFFTSRNVSSTVKRRP